MLKGAFLAFALLAIAPRAHASPGGEPVAPEGEAAPAGETRDVREGRPSPGQSAEEPGEDRPESLSEASSTAEDVKRAPELELARRPAPEPPPPLSLAPEGEKRRAPPFTGEEFRYDKLWLIPRGILSGIAIPASMATWDERDVARFASVTLTVTALMLPAGPSADVRIQQTMRGADTPGLDRFFPKIYTIPMTIALGTYTTALSAGFFFFKRPRLREYVSLMLEALGITQFYHVALKLMIGREGPYQGDRMGRVHGPTKLSFPGGTPSGHAASAFAVLVTAAEYYGGWPLKLVCYLASIYMAASFMYNNQHFISDVVWGAAIGDHVAKWVVRHRAVDARPSKRTKLVFSPMALPGGVGVRFSLSGGSFM